MTIKATDLKKVAVTVTKRWTRQRKAEERSLRGVFSRSELFEARRVTFVEVAREFLVAAYAHASGDGKYTVSKRQLYYASRDEFRRWTGREISADYFSNDLLVKFLNRYPDLTRGWKITADPRGTLTIPNAGREIRIPCGTLAIEEHLRTTAEPVDAMDYAPSVRSEWPALGPGERYQAVLYIEKEGFEPLLDEAEIAERYDLAILSCKGQSVVAARRFVDEACRIDKGVPLFVVHDFDKAGFEISQRLTSVSKWAEENDRVAYRFQHTVNVTDLGLKLCDVEKYRLRSEAVEFKGKFASDSIATPEEKEFLRSGRRVELNAFTSPQFLEWLESKLSEQGLGKRLIPEDDVLESAYRRALAVAKINRAIDDAKAQAMYLAESARIPKSLRRELQRIMKAQPDLAWDGALYQLVQQGIRNSGDGPFAGAT